VSACRQLLAQHVSSGISRWQRSGADIGQVLDVMTQVLKSHANSTLIQLNVLMRDELLSLWPKA
jgi:hypothetical protein